MIPRQIRGAPTINLPPAHVIPILVASLVVATVLIPVAPMVVAAVPVLVAPVSVVGSTALLAGGLFPITVGGKKSIRFKLLVHVALIFYFCHRLSVSAVIQTCNDDPAP